MDKLDPRSTALLLLDYQQGVLHALADGDRLSAAVAQGLQIARSAGVAVHYVRLALDESDMVSVPAGNLTFSRLAQMGRFAAGSEATLIPAAIAPVAGDGVHEKTRVGAFRTTGLHEALRAGGIDTLLLAGIHTSGVVLSTVRDAADLDYRIFVVHDLCADPDPQIHDVLMDQIFPAQASVVCLDQLSEALR